MRVKEALLYASDKLKENRIENSLNEAKYLLKYLLETDDIFFITNLDNELESEKLDEYKKLVEKRCKHIPFSYITGTKEFMGLEFYVDNQTLIPRPETEIIVEYMINNFSKQNLNILEIGVGSGCISISTAYYLKNINILGVDINEKALITANRNIQKHNLENRVKFIKSDIYENIKDKFDMIISNPPYIKKDVIKTLDRDVKDYEPILALDGGEDGLYFYREIINNAKKYLTENGHIILEIGYDQKKEVTDLLKENDFIQIKTIKDLAGFDRTIIAKLQ